ncbi:MAG TPA: FGGY family carbohydrate kinase [Chitinophagaceae bacterium]|nr:FGGY family carbohydrate kinase [Chitinophagaceae bacterium]
MNAYLIIDIGTGNVRVAVVSTAKKILHIERADVHYEKDDKYPEALYFEPDVLWEQVIALTERALAQVPGVCIKAITASSQREGIVVLDREGHSLIGLPNHDHRGREWESILTDKHRVYAMTGRYPTSLFSALKLVALKGRHPELAEKIGTFMSISDWAQYKLCGVMGYEHSQASETLLYDIEQGCWSDELCEMFGIERSLLPSLHWSGTVLGNIMPQYADKWHIDQGTPVIVGGADTQLAIKSTQPASGDIVIVSGTTTPVIKVTEEYLLDEKERTWTNRHVEGAQFILETNCGVTGLNYQRLRECFYPNEGYDRIEAELDGLKDPSCMASLGSLLAGEDTPLTTGGFVFNAPVSQQLSRADFAWAILWDIACCIKENYESLVDKRAYDRDYVWACGGGLQSKHLRTFIAGLIDKKIRIRQGFQQASVTGGAVICTEMLGGNDLPDADMDIVYPENQAHYHMLYEKWKKTRHGFRKMAETIE